MEHIDAAINALNRMSIQGLANMQLLMTAVSALAELRSKMEADRVHTGTEEPAGN